MWVTHITATLYNISLCDISNLRYIGVMCSCATPTKSIAICVILYWKAAIYPANAARYCSQPYALSQLVSNLFIWCGEKKDSVGAVELSRPLKSRLYTEELLLTLSPAKGLHTTSPSPPPAPPLMPAVSVSLMSSHFCAFSSSLFLRGKG